MAGKEGWGWQGGVGLAGRGSTSSHIPAIPELITFQVKEVGVE